MNAQQLPADLCKVTKPSPLTLSLWRFDPDSDHRRAVALRVDVEENDSEQPLHSHRKGQLVVALRGGVTCDVAGGRWMVPPQFAVWIPGGLVHSNRVITDARLCFLFLEPGAVRLPDACCTLAISPLVRELVLHLADKGRPGVQDDTIDGIVTVLLGQLAQAPIERLYLPLPDHPGLRRIADALTSDPGDRTTLEQWADALAMSPRSLARLVKSRTSMTFGRWRQQLQLIVALGELASKVPVQEVASHLGYDSVTAFIAMFKKALGTSPGRYFASREDCISIAGGVPASGGASARRASI